MKKRFLIAAIVIIVGYGLSKFFITKDVMNRAPAHSSTREDMLVSVLADGNIHAVEEKLIKNKLRGISQITYMVEESSYVKKGDLLIEFSSQSIKDSYENQKEFELIVCYLEVILKTRDVVCTHTIQKTERSAEKTIWEMSDQTSPTGKSSEFCIQENAFSLRECVSQTLVLACLPL